MGLEKLICVLPETLPEHLLTSAPLVRTDRATESYTVLTMVVAVSLTAGGFLSKWRGGSDVFGIDPHILDLSAIPQEGARVM